MFAEEQTTEKIYCYGKKQLPSYPGEQGLRLLFESWCSKDFSTKKHAKSFSNSKRKTEALVTEFN